MTIYVENVVILYEYFVHLEAEYRLSPSFSLSLLFVGFVRTSYTVSTWLLFTFTWNRARFSLSPCVQCTSCKSLYCLLWARATSNKMRISNRYSTLLKYHYYYLPWQSRNYWAIQSASFNISKIRRNLAKFMTINNKLETISFQFIRLLQTCITRYLIDFNW